MTSSLMADAANIHLVGGIGLSDLDSQHNVLFDQTSGYTNLYDTAGKSTRSPIFGLGLGYQWDHLTRGLPIALNLGLTGYYLRNSISGTEYPAAGLLSVSSDPVGYTAWETTFALMLEAKIIYTAYAWQPYLITGMGAASNRSSGFNQQQIAGSTNSPSSGSAFSSHTKTSLAYELGVGLQHAVYESPSGEHLILGIEYRYLFLGAMGFGTAPAQNTTPGLQLGNLKTNVFDASLNWEF